MLTLNNGYLPLETHYLNVPYYNQQRRIRVLLPADYYDSRDSYPVLYMHDGQNVFYSREAFAGYSWKVIHLVKEHTELPPMIIVGIDNSEERRLDEYTPWRISQAPNPDFQAFGGDGDKYADWVVNTVKPFMDNNYRTLKNRKNTMLAGSSLGGLITAYMGAKYPNVFGSLGVFSNAAWICGDDFTKYILSHPLNAKTRVYIQSGTNESDAGDDDYINPDFQAQKYIDGSIEYEHLLIQSGHSLDKMCLRIFCGESHNEYFWAKHFPEFMDFCFNE